MRARLGGTSWRSQLSQRKTVPGAGVRWTKVRSASGASALRGGHHQGQAGILQPQGRGTIRLDGLSAEHLPAVAGSGEFKP